MARTQADIARQMVQQLRVLDPSVSADIGTPERKIIDTVAQAIADAQVDLNALSGALDLDSKFGSNLDKFLAVLGFARQVPTAATGVVTFSRTTGATQDIRISAGTQVASSVATGDDGAPSTYLTTADVILDAGDLSVDVPIRCVTPGTLGNVAAGTITQFVGSSALGVTAVTNPTATTGGSDGESDNELKLRFRNTVFRNVSGTEDQYLALAASAAFTTKANVVGPISRYREYIQIPDVDDSVGGNGGADTWTTALSTIPYSKHIYETVPAFVSNGASGVLGRFYTQDLDFSVNFLPSGKNYGDAYRQRATLDPLSDAAIFKPNVSFFTVYTGTDTTIDAPRPGDVALFEHSYISSESRNDYVNNILNCVDMFVDGTNPTRATIVIPTPRIGSGVFTSNPTSRLYAENYRRIGEPEHRPIAGNYFTGLLFQPVTDLPASIQVGTDFYDLGVHYWALEEVSDIGGTIRSRNGIEWSATVPGRASSDPAIGPYSGSLITSNATTSAEVQDFIYDRNIVDLQSAVEAAKQVTTDALVHRARVRYLKLAITVMYSPGATIASVNQSISDALTTFLSGQFFGTVIQLSDLLQVVHNVAGVDNVRWTSEVDPTYERVVETNAQGASLVDAVVDRVVAGTSGVSEQQTFYFPNPPSDPSNTYVVSYRGCSTTPITFDASASAVQAAINTAITPTGDTVTVSGAGTVASPFSLTFANTVFKTSLISVAASFYGTPRSHNRDFFLNDNELPALPIAAVAGDTLPGLIIKPRAQNTF